MCVLIIYHSIAVGQNCVDIFHAGEAASFWCHHWVDTIQTRYRNSLFPSHDCKLGRRCLRRAPCSCGICLVSQFMGPYGVSKTAMLGLVKAMAPQCGQKNIRINGIAPGLIKTNFSSVVRSIESSLPIFAQVRTNDGNLSLRINASLTRILLFFSLL